MDNLLYENDKKGKCSCFCAVCGEEGAWVTCVGKENPLALYPMSKE